MRNTLRNIVLQTILPVLCGLIALNAYLVYKNLKLTGKNTAQRVQASEIEADISRIGFDLQTMETSQRGYLLTNDPSYLTSYNEANGKLATHFADLRPRLAGKDRSLEAQLESVAESKIAEMKETIRLREQGYRHRAFVIVSSNRGKELMEQARSTLDALSSAQTGNVARYDRETRASIVRAVAESTLGSCILLAVTIVTLLALNRYRRRLETGYARQAEELRATSLQLEQLTSTIFHNFRGLMAQIQSHAHTLLDVYGGFLPRQGQEKAERIEEGAGQMICLLDDIGSGRSLGWEMESKLPQDVNSN